jgi:hypothetical protein
MNRKGGRANRTNGVGRERWNSTDVALLVHSLSCRCHRDLKPGETLTRFEQGLLKVRPPFFFFLSALISIHLPTSDNASIHTHALTTAMDRPIHPTFPKSLPLFTQVINNIYYLPPWVPAKTYVDLAQKEGLQVRIITRLPTSTTPSIHRPTHTKQTNQNTLPTKQNVRSADWTETVKPFWPAVLRSSFNLRAVKVFLRSRNVRRGALAILVRALPFLGDGVGCGGRGLLLCV